MHRLLLTATCWLLFVVGCWPAAAQHPSPAAPIGAVKSLTAADWSADLDLLIQQLETLHPAPFARRDRAAFHGDVEALREAFPRMKREQAVVGIMRLVASLEDGHTSVMPQFLAGQGFRVLPLRFYAYPDGLYVQGGDQGYSALIGGKLVRIGGVPAEEVYARVAGLVPHDNELTVAGRLPAYLVIPELLAGLGIIESADASVEIVVESGGRALEASVAPVPLRRLGAHSEIGAAYTETWIDAANGSPRPLWLRHPDQPYWMEYLADSGTLYVQYNQAANDPHEGMPQFARRLRGEVEARSPERVVLDLRLNSGGELFWNSPLLMALVRSDHLEAPGRLFVLTGRETYSAGTIMAVDLERLAGAVVIGEPTGGSVQNYGNHQLVTLPHSGLSVLIATRFYQTNGPHDVRQWVAPSLAAELTAAAYAAGRDPVLEAALQYRPVATVLRAALDAAPPEDARTAFESVTSQRAYRYLNREAALIAVGYSYLREGQHERAIAAFGVATQAFPQSANTFDSLGDAFKAAGRRDEAIASYHKALAIAPGWVSARHSLSELGAAAPPQRTLH